MHPHDCCPADVRMGKCKKCQCIDTIDQGQDGTHCLRAVCAAAGHQADHRHGDAVLSAELLQRLSVSRSLVAKPEALSHHHARDLTS